MKSINYAAALVLGLSLSGVAAAETSLTLTSAIGEFENHVDTERHTAEVRIQAADNVYGIVYAGAFDHPRHEIKDRIMVGAGFQWKDWNFELVGDDDRYLSSVMFTAPTEVWEIRGGLLHGNKWEEGFKQTGVKVSVGYPVLDALTVGGFYEIGNTTMKSVDDLYGGYAKWVF